MSSFVPGACRSIRAGRLLETTWNVPQIALSGILMRVLAACRASDTSIPVALGVLDCVEQLLL